MESNSFALKPRARRVTIAVAVLVAMIVAILAVANWGTVRDHVEAWHFQLTRETKTIPHPSGCPMIFASNDQEAMSTPMRLPDQYANVDTDDVVLTVLRHCGWRVLEQRFPRRAYVVIRAVDPAVLLEGRLREDWNARLRTTAPAAPQPILWDGVYPSPRARDPDSELPAKRFGLEVR